MSNKLIPIGSYDYEGLCKSFLAQDRTFAKTANDRLSYSGKYLHSYDSVLAKISDTIPSTLYIDKRISTYSATSRRHTDNLILAVSGDWTIFTIDLNLSAADNLLKYWKEVDYYITKYRKARSRKPIIKQEINKLVHTAQTFAEFHKLDSIVPDHIMRQLFVYQLFN